MRTHNDILKDVICYLAGPIDNTSDQGMSWRREIVQKCKNKEIKIKFLDPTHKISSLKKEVEEEQQRIQEMKRLRHFDNLNEFMKPVVRGDHRCIDLADFIICYIDVDVHMCGSYFELQSALTEKKPYFLIVKGGKHRAPSWLFGITDHKRMFSNIDGVVGELSELNSGSKPLDNRWVLIREELKKL